MIDYATPEVTDETGDGSTGSHVVFIAIGGEVTIEKYGNQLGDRISGRFNLQLRGERNRCTDPPECDEVAEKTIEGTAVGQFSGVLKLEEEYSAGSAP